jgi:large subunit ribosomal protein L15
MKYNELDITKHKSGKRLGRGISAGGGKTAGRGTKGQKARTGSKKKPGFQGGSNPIMQSLPKLHGFHSHRVKAEVVYTGQIEALGKAKVDNHVLADAQLVSSPFVVTKLLLNGELKKNVSIHLQSASKQAAEAVVKAGGSFEQVARVKRPVTSTKSIAKKTEEKKAK